MGGGGIGPISETGIGGSGSSDNTNGGWPAPGGGRGGCTGCSPCDCFSWAGGVEPGGPICGPSVTVNRGPI